MAFRPSKSAAKPRVSTGQGGRDGGHVAGGGGPLERDVGRDPRGRPDIEVGVEIGHRARAENRRVDVTRSHRHGQAGRHSEVPGGLGGDRPHHRPGSHQVGQPSPVQSGDLEQPPVVVHVVDPAVVGHPVGGDGVERRRPTPGQSEVQVVHRLEEDLGAPIDVGEGVTDEQDVGDRVLARQTGCTTGHLDPTEDLAGVVPEDVDRTAGHTADGLVAT